MEYLHAPARSFLKGIVQRNGYHSYERCTIRGIHESNTTCFAGRAEAPRTDAEFPQLLYNAPDEDGKCHQLSKSPLLDVNINCVSEVVLDYMHVVCEGVVKRLINFSFFSDKSEKV